MKPRSWNRHWLVATLGVLTALLVCGRPARADGVYQLDDGSYEESFNNNQGMESEDNWVANSFQVNPDGTRLLSISFVLGQPLTNVAATGVIYLGSDLSDPTNLTRIATTDSTVSGDVGTLVTITLDTPVDLNPGDIFFAAVLIRGVAGDVFPFTNDTDDPLGQSFFDVGPNQGDAYDLDNTSNAVVLGGTHSVVGDGIQSPGNLILRVNATTTPCP
jgi:hypothetical protein